MNINKIPTNLEEAIDCIHCLLPYDELMLISSEDESVMIKYHHTLGRLIRNEWGLWTRDSQLYLYLVNLGLWHPDDMSSLILDSLYNHINGLSFDIESKIKKYQEYWEKQCAV